MTSTFHGLELGKRALFAQQAALSTTGHNIANANTTGYTRQRAEMQATNALPAPGISNDTSPAQLGTGVEVTEIARLRESYLDVQYRDESKNSGYWTAVSDTYSKIEELLNEPSDNGLANTMDTFWQGWEELSKNPDSAAARAVVRQNGVAVAESFNQISSSLDQMQTDLKNVIETKVSEVNSLAKQISSLNDQISRLVANDYQPNDLYDQRDVLLDQLSKIVPIKTVQNTNGMVDVSVGSGGVLVTGHTANSLSIGYDSSSGLVDPAQITIGGSKVTMDSGELMGNIDSYGIEGDTDSIIPNLRAKLDDLVNTFSAKINEIHNSGLNLDNIKNGTTDTVDFFQGSSMKDIAVNDAIMNNLDLIAAANPESSGSSSTGNGGNALDIANIKFLDLQFSGSTSSADDFYQNIIAQVGVNSQQATRLKDNSDVIIQQVDNRRQSISGVSIDEETANMIKFQQAYNAAARVVSVMDECLDKIINGMGRVGL